MSASYLLAFLPNSYPKSKPPGIPATNQGIIRKYPAAIQPTPKARQYPGYHNNVILTLPSFHFFDNIYK